MAVRNCDWLEFFNSLLKVFEPEHFFHEPPKWNLFDKSQLLVFACMLGTTQALILVSLYASAAPANSLPWTVTFGVVAAAGFLLATNLHFYYGGPHRNWLQHIYFVVVLVVTISLT
ncbi:MAG: hypothetical protein KF691_03410 [Phycisphaeraceae bacterium]|nr:hypothetical protein [Phycisphaeraceae bacterium]